MRIEKAEKNEMEEWSRLWREQERQSGRTFIRQLGTEYFEGKYFGEYEMSAYCVKQDETIIGFFGIKRIKEGKLETIAFCDFILNPFLQGKGYFTQIVSKIRNELFSNGEILVFYPINRDAMISWKFALKPQIVEKLSRWIIDLKTFEIPDRKTAYSFELIAASKEYWMQIKVLFHEQAIGTICVNKVMHEGKSGMEVCMMQMEQICLETNAELFFNLFQYAKQNNFDFVICKMSETLSINKELESKLACRKQKEILYKFLVCEEARKEEIEKWNPVTIGEPLDIPRDDSLIHKFYMGETIEMNGGRYETRGEVFVNRKL